MSNEERFFIPTGGSALHAYRAFRAWAEGQAAVRGETLDPAWYLDGPEDLPELYEELPWRAKGSPGQAGGDDSSAGRGDLPDMPGASASDDGSSEA